MYKQKAIQRKRMILEDTEYIDWNFAHKIYNVNVQLELQEDICVRAGCIYAYMCYHEFCFECITIELSIDIIHLRMLSFQVNV